jgi:hypothetical protein
MSDHVKQARETLSDLVSYIPNVDRILKDEEILEAIGQMLEQDKPDRLNAAYRISMAATAYQSGCKKYQILAYLRQGILTGRW